MFKWSLRVYIEDTDFGGIVYYANYLKFMERARTEWLRSLNLLQSELEQQDLLFVVTEVDVKYRKPAKLDDELVVSVSAVPKGRTSMAVTQQITRKASPEEILTVGTVVVTAIGRDGRPRRLPAAIKNKMSSIS